MSDQALQVETTERELTITRVFNAPRELVFEAHTSCRHLKHWWGPRAWPMEECEMDFREGGTWHFCLRGPNDDDESWGLANFDEIVAPERIVYRDHFSDADGTINEAMPAMLVTLEFYDQDGKTKLVSSTRFETPEELQTTVGMGAIDGMTETWDRLQEYLENVK